MQTYINPFKQNHDHTKIMLFVVTLSTSEITKFEKVLSLEKVYSLQAKIFLA